MKFYAYVAETYLSHNKKWIELKTLSTLAEAEEFLCEHFDNIVTSLDNGDCGDMSVETMMKNWGKKFRITEMEVV